MENFITNIYIKESRNVKDLNIPLSKDHRQHLILTGKNGAGKTSLLENLRDYVTGMVSNLYMLSVLSNIDQPQTPTEQMHVNKYVATLSKKLEIKFPENKEYLSRQILATDHLVLAYFNSKRIPNLSIPQGIKKFDLQKKYGIEDKANANFMQFLVNLKAERSFAKDDEELEVVHKIDAWFERFETALKTIFDTHELALEFDRKNYDFSVVVPDRESFSLTTLSDGYAAIMSIVTELILRMESKKAAVYDVEGIVLIDEIETHLHVDLQKKILPFLTEFFPRIQFIVTTHSPFVISSISNATVCDLEKRIVATDLSNYSYDAIIESYYGTDKYSKELKEKLTDYEQLMNQKELSAEQEDKLFDLEDYFEDAPTHGGIAPELETKLKEIKNKVAAQKSK